jgi:hypothetical protein
MTDSTYQIIRDSLIQEAVKYANQVCGRKPPKSKEHTRDNSVKEWSAKWTQVYFSKMDELVRKKGI